MEGLRQASPVAGGAVGGSVGRLVGEHPSITAAAKSLLSQAQGGHSELWHSMHALLFFLIPGTTNPHPHSGVYTPLPTHPPHREGCAHTPTNILSHNLHTYIPKGFLPRACQAPSREGCGIS